VTGTWSDFDLSDFFVSASSLPNPKMALEFTDGLYIVHCEGQTWNVVQNMELVKLFNANTYKDFQYTNWHYKSKGWRSWEQTNVKTKTTRRVCFMQPPPQVS